MKFSAKKLQTTAFISALLFYGGIATADSSAHWQVLSDKSTISWTATYGGKPVTGNFPDFTADIAFDPQHLDEAKAVVKIEMDKIKSADHDAEQNLPTADWFAASKFPLATFNTTGFTHVKDDRYEAQGDLKVRDKSVKVNLPFTLKIEGSAAHLDGETTVKRTALGVGQGDWSATDSIADDVKVAIHIEAKQVP